MKTNAQFPEEHSDGGEFERQEDAFRAWLAALTSGQASTRSGCGCAEP